jgi:hypothetical protein
VPEVRPHLASKGLPQEAIVLIGEAPPRPVQDFGSVAMAQFLCIFCRQTLLQFSPRHEEPQKEISLSRKIQKRLCLDDEMDVKEFWKKIYTSRDVIFITAEG